MTGARQKHSRLERQIAKQLGLSDAQLDALLRIRAGYWPGSAAAVLVAKGYAFQNRDEGGYTIERGLTETGHELLHRARQLGF
jgi:hypothetical protein